MSGDHPFDTNPFKIISCFVSIKVEWQSQTIDYWYVMKSQCSLSIRAHFIFFYLILSDNLKR